jgi:hypothetical protein
VKIFYIQETNYKNYFALIQYKTLLNTLCSAHNAAFFETKTIPKSWKNVGPL